MKCSFCLITKQVTLPNCILILWLPLWEISVLNQDHWLSSPVSYTHFRKRTTSPCYLVISRYTGSKALPKWLRTEYFKYSILSNICTLHSAIPRLFLEFPMLFLGISLLFGNFQCFLGISNAFLEFPCFLGISNAFWEFPMLFWNFQCFFWNLNLKEAEGLRSVIL